MRVRVPALARHKIFIRVGGLGLWEYTEHPKFGARASI